MPLPARIKGNMEDLEKWLNPKLAECKGLQAVETLMNKFEDYMEPWVPIKLDEAEQDPKNKKLKMSDLDLGRYIYTFGMVANVSYP